MQSTFILLALCSFVASTPWEEQTILDEYIARPESVYEYTLDNIDTSQPGRSVHFINLTSLTYFDDTLTTTPVWYHHLAVIIPDTPTYTDSFVLYVSSGNSDDDVPSVGSGSVQDMIRVSEATGAVTAVIRQIPNQPVYFVNEDNGTRPRTEDAIIGYTWRLLIEDTITDRTVNMLFPMTKAAKLAADTVIEYVNGANPTYNLDSYVPTGFSKRGWVTWLLGCVDQRTIGLAPVVFDLLNFYENLVHHNRALGGWSWAFTAYWNAGVSRYLHHPTTQIIGNDIDPLAYNARLTMPKLLSGSSGDEFFFPDGTHFWWDQMNGDENHYALFENDNHGVGDHRDILWANLASFFITLKEPAYALPSYTVTQERGIFAGKISVQIDQAVNWVRVWSADTSNRTCEPEDNVLGICRRDFRLARFEVPTSNLIEWTSTPLEDLGGGLYEVEMDGRTDFGFRIFHVEMEFAQPGGTFRLTTETNILPDAFNYPECASEEQCHGVLK